MSKVLNLYHDCITDRELEIISLVAQDYTEKQIAFSLGISKQTVKNHTWSCRVKLGQQTKVGLSMWYVANFGIPTKYKFKPFQTNRPIRLSPRQEHVAHLLSCNLTDRQIGQRLGIPTGAVRSCIFAIRKKLTLSTSQEIAEWYLQNYNKVS